MTTTAGQATSLGRHYNGSQLRADTWNRLKVLAQRLTEKRARGADTGRIEPEIAAALDVLEPIESYWAFPGKQAFRHIRKRFEQGDYSRLTRLVARIVRALVSQSYRRGVTSSTVYHDAEMTEDDDAILDLANGQTDAWQIQMVHGHVRGPA